MPGTRPKAYRRGKSLAAMILISLAAPAVVAAKCNCFCSVSLDPAYNAKGTPPGEVFTLDERPALKEWETCFPVNPKEEKCRSACAAASAVDMDRYNNDQWWCRTLARPFDQEITLYSKIGDMKWRAAGKRRVQCKRCCDCPRGIYDPARNSCADRIACAAPGLPDGDKGGGYSAVGGQLFVDVPGAENCEVVPGTGSCEPPCDPAPCDCDAGELTISSSTEVRESCDREGGHSATITLAVTGGAPDYTVKQLQGPQLRGVPATAASPFILTGATFGIYLFEITDRDGTVVTTSVEVEDPIRLTVTSIPATCPGCSDGRAEVDVEGGTSPYTFRWNDDRQQTAGRAVDLAPGTYRVDVTDARGCRRTGEAVVGGG